MDYLMSSKAQYQLLIILISNLVEKKEVLFSWQSFYYDF